MTHSCPGHCGRQVVDGEFACQECWGRLPSDMRQAIRVGRIVDPNQHHEAMRLGRDWFDQQLPAGYRRVDPNIGCPYEWTGSMWRHIPPSEVDAEAWRRSRGESP